MKPPSMVNNSVDANFPLYISCSERMTAKRRNEYSMELPGPAMKFRLHHKNTSTKSQILNSMRTKPHYKKL